MKKSGYYQAVNDLLAEHLTDLDKRMRKSDAAKKNKEQQEREPW